MSEASQGLRDLILQRYKLRYPASSGEENWIGSAIGKSSLSPERLFDLHLLLKRREGKSEEEGLRELTEDCESWISSEIEKRKKYGLARLSVRRSDKGLENRALIFGLDRILEIPLGHAGLVASLLLAGPTPLGGMAQEAIETGRVQGLDATKADELAKRHGAESWPYEEIAQVDMRGSQMMLRLVDGREIKYGAPELMAKEFQQSMAWLASALGSRLLIYSKDQILPHPTLSPLDCEIAHALKVELQQIASRIGSALVSSPQPTKTSPLLDYYRRKHPSNSEGVLEFHLGQLMKAGKTREEAERELMKEHGIT